MSIATANGTVETANVMTLDEAAAYLRVSPDDVLVAVATAKLAGQQIGKQWRFSRHALNRWLESPSPSSIAATPPLGPWTAESAADAEAEIDEIKARRRLTGASA
jgi:excisionase family DNA binding protein